MALQEGQFIDLEKARRWVAALRDFSQSVLDDLDKDDPFADFLSLACDAAPAQGAAVFLESIGDQWLCEGAYFTPEAESERRSGGHTTDAAGAIGMRFVASEHTKARLRLFEGTTIATPGRSAAEQALEETWFDVLGVNGPVLYVPVGAGNTPHGCLILWRAHGDAPFAAADVPPAIAYAVEGSLVLDLMSAKQSQNLAALYEERERISRDLHDMAIQGLFATGMKLRNIRQELEPGGSNNGIDRALIDAIDSLESSVTQIRAIVYRLSEIEETAGLVEKLTAEVSSARSSLGFAPTFVIEVDGRPLSTSTSTAPSISSLQEKPLVEQANHRTREVAEDVVAVVRESLANAAKHAGSSSVRVRIEINGVGPSGEIIVTVIDDGRGISRSTDRESGVANMSRRAALRRGTFAIGAGIRGKGTSVVWRSPLA